MVESSVYSPAKCASQGSNPNSKGSLFLTPGLFVELGKCNFAISRIDSVHSGTALRIKITFRVRPVRSGDAILLVRDGLASFVEQFDLDPVAGLGGDRTCRTGQG